MYNLIAKNKRRSVILVILFILVIIGLGWLLTRVTEGGEVMILIAFVFSIFSVVTSYFVGDKMILASVKAKPVPKKADPELYNVVENLAITAGIPMPKVYMMQDSALNAFATGRDPEHASVAITSGLRKALSRPELEAVMAHELSHVKHYDIRLMLFTAVLVGMILFLANILWRVSATRGGGKRGNILIIPALIIGLIGAPIAAQLIKMALSRRREFLADAGSVMLTRYPESMISALQKIARAPAIKGHHEAIAHLFIYPPFKKKSFWTKMLSTHPPIEDRISIIQQASRIKSLDDLQIIR